MKKYIPQIEPWIQKDEVREISEVVRSTFISENKKTELFLSLIKEFTGSKYAIAISNGTLALAACLMAENIGPGDEVIVPDLTFIATANAVILTGAKPVFCDVDRETGCIDSDDMLQCITKRTRAVIPVHLYGLMAEMASINRIAQAHHLVVIEDAAEAFGVFYNKKHAGTYGSYGTFSFYANKTITCGEGGVILTDALKRYKQIYRVKNHGRDKKGTFIHKSIGYNFCFSDLNAAIGVAQFKKIDTIMSRKKRNFDTYKKRLSHLNGIKIMEPDRRTRSNYWFCNVLTQKPAAFASYLHEHGVGTRRLFYPLHLQPCYKGLVSKRQYESSTRLYSKGLSLPSSSTLTLKELHYICDLIERYFK
ncbi:MAG: DegT/DnrJ/EryC1/StrS family aminotransferase [Candidatus Aureabacteria bacterium]|nr:DegT/DnrJ/EryC1/StrS family aminotransferase [Candidatus Auribacterota bacterium]